MVILKGMGWGGMLVRLCLFTLFSLLPMPRGVPEILMSLFWLHCQLGLRCSWCIWPLSPSQGRGSTLLGAWGLLLSITMIMLGTTSGSSGLGLSLGQHLQQCTTRL
nr:aquaporin PIP1 [Piper nigrum]